MPNDLDLSARLFALLDGRCGEIVPAPDLIAALGLSGAGVYRYLYVVVSRARDTLPAGCEILTIREQGYMLRRR